MIERARTPDAPGHASPPPPGAPAERPWLASNRAVSSSFEDGLRGAGGGTPIPAGVRESLEAGLGTSLGSVRLHTGAASASLSDQVGAHAFTVGQDVHFAQGTYDPTTSRGYHLLAHEVAHTLQPDTGAIAGSLAVGPGDSPAERSAEAIATDLTAGRAVSGPFTAGGGCAVVRRFGREEHKELGDATHADVDLGNGLILTWGDVVSLAGDEFESVADLQAAAATPQGRAELKRIMASDDNHSAQYVDLAMHNVPHFAGGGTAMWSWSSHHDSALLTALMSGLNDNPEQWQQAQLTEAFGQHFLTDSFSAGHVRTPRSDIINWYQDDFAPRALPPMIAWAKNWLRTELVRQISPQVLMPDACIGAMVDAVMWGALKWFDDDIREKLQPLVGLGISGAISGTLHDRDNERGLWVASEAHPGESIAALNQAADFLTAHSEQVLDISGHTDPLGTDAYNDGLGQRRADAVATYLMTRGILPHRLKTATVGERQLLSAERAGFPLDRRAELSYRASGDAPDDAVWAQQILAERMPHSDVTRYVPHEEVVLNDPQEDWHWGTMSNEMAASINHWIASYASTAVAAVASDKRLDDTQIPVPDIFNTAIVKISPRKPVQDLLNALVADGTGLLGQMVGIPAANHSVPPLPPPVACAVPAAP